MHAGTVWWSRSRKRNQVPDLASANQVPSYGRSINDTGDSRLASFHPSQHTAASAALPIVQLRLNPAGSRHFGPQEPVLGRTFPCKGCKACKWSGGFRWGGHTSDCTECTMQGRREGACTIFNSPLPGPSVSSVRPDNPNSPDTSAVRVWYVSNVGCWLQEDRETGRTYAVFVVQESLLGIWTLVVSDVWI